MKVNVKSGRDWTRTGLLALIALLLGVIVLRHAGQGESAQAGESVAAAGYVLFTMEDARGRQFYVFDTATESLLVYRWLDADFRLMSARRVTDDFEIPDSDMRELRGLGLGTQNGVDLRTVKTAIARLEAQGGVKQILEEYRSGKRP